MKLRLTVHVFGTDWVMKEYHSAEIDGKDAEEMKELLNRLPEVEMMTFPDTNGDLVFLQRSMLDRSIITCKIEYEDN